MIRDSRGQVKRQHKTKEGRRLRTTHDWRQKREQKIEDNRRLETTTNRRLKTYM